MSLNSGMVDQNASISHDSTHGTGQVTVDLNEFLTALGGDFKLGWLHLLLNSEDHTFICFNSDSRRTELYESDFVTKSSESQSWLEA